MNNTYSYSRRHTISGPATFACTLMACVACWIVSYLNSVGYPVYGEVTAPPLWNAICQVLPGKAFTYAIGMLLMFGGAFLLHRVNYVLVLIREKTLLPFLFYVLFISTNPDFLPLKSTSVGVFCLILAIYQLFTSYHDPGAKSKAYNASLLIGIGSLLWVHILWFIPLFWIGMYNFRSLSIRTFLASLLGVGTVYWFLLGWCIWFRDFTPFTIPFATLFKIRILAAAGIGLLDWVGIIAIAILTAVSAINIITHEYEDVLRTRQFLSFLICMSVWAFALYFLYEQASEEFLETACIPSAILIAHFFTVMRGKIVFWTFYLSLSCFYAYRISYRIRIYRGVHRLFPRSDDPAFQQRSRPDRCFTGWFCLLALHGRRHTGQLPGRHELLLARHAGKSGMDREIPQTGCQKAAKGTGLDCR